MNDDTQKFGESQDRIRATPEFQQLQEKLLAIGGVQVVPMPDPTLNVLLQRGRVFQTTKRKLLKGPYHHCHQIAAVEYAKHQLYGRACIEIVTGYALDKQEDGYWRQHSWLWDGQRVIEPNTEPCLYYGVISNPVEAARHVFWDVMMRLLGAREMFEGVRAA